MSTGKALNREKILTVALMIADQDGIEALSMRKLGAELSVQAMSLYNHITNRDEIIDALVEMVIEEMGTPDPRQPWKKTIRTQAHATHDVLLRHPWASMEIISRMNIGPARFRYVDRMIGCFVTAGFTNPQADHAMNTVESYIYGFTLQELTFPLAPGTYQDVASDYIDRIPYEQYPYLHGMAQSVISGEYDGIHDFSTGLAVILDAVESIKKRTSFR